MNEIVWRIFVAFSKEPIQEKAHKYLWARFKTQSRMPFEKQLGGSWNGSGPAGT